MLNKYDFKYILRRVLTAIIISLILMYIGSLKVNASTLVDFDLGNAVQFSCNDTYDINENWLTTNDSNIRQVRRNKGCYIKKPNGYDYLFIQPSFNLTYIYNNIPSYIQNSTTYTSDIISYNKRVFITYNGETRYCQQQDTYAICNINNLTNDIDQYINIIIGFDISFNNLNIGGNGMYQYVRGNISLSPIIQYGRLYNSQIAGISDNINNVNDSINSNEAPSTSDVSNNTSDWSSSNAQNGVITNLLTLPIKLLNGYVSGINSSCSSFNLGSLYGTNLVLPCINVSNYIGSTLWGVIDVLFSGFMIFAIGKKLVRIFNDFTNLRDHQIDELYGGGA